jgi:hypothetical protein
MKTVHVIDFEHDGRRYLQHVQREGLRLELVGQPEPAPPRGFGDTVAAITTVVGIKPCGGCKARQEALNKLFPFGNNSGADL